MKKKRKDRFQRIVRTIIFNVKSLKPVRPYFPPCYFTYNISTSELLLPVKSIRGLINTLLILPAGEFSNSSHGDCTRLLNEEKLKEGKERERKRGKSEDRRWRTMICRELCFHFSCNYTFIFICKFIGEEREREARGRDNVSNILIIQKTYRVWREIC